MLAGVIGENQVCRQNMPGHLVRVWQSGLPVWAPPICVSPITPL